MLRPTATATGSRTSRWAGVRAASREVLGSVLSGPGVLTAERDDAIWRAALAERQLEILRGRLLNMNPHARTEYLPGDKLAILEIMWLYGWSIVETAKRFVLHRNTISSWLGRFRGEADPDAFFGRPPWNKIGESVRWLVHEMRSLGVEFGAGTRAIAVEIRRIDAKVGRSSGDRHGARRPQLLYSTCRSPTQEESRRRQDASAGGPGACGADGGQLDSGMSQPGDALVPPNISAVTPARRLDVSSTPRVIRATSVAPPGHTRYHMFVMERRG